MIAVRSKTRERNFFIDLTQSYGLFQEVFHQGKELGSGNSHSHSRSGFGAPTKHSEAREVGVTINQ